TPEELAAAAAKEAEENDSDGDSDSDDDSDSEEESTPVDTGPDPLEVARRIGELRTGYAKFQKLSEKHGLGDKKALKLRDQIAEEFLKLKLPAILIDSLVRKLREVVSNIRHHERLIMDVCIKQAKMPRKEFLKVFPSNET